MISIYVRVFKRDWERMKKAIEQSSVAMENMNGIIEKLEKENKQLKQQNTMLSNKLAGKGIILP